MSDPYLYEEIPVLKNKLDIRVEETLALVEAELSRANMMLLYEQGFHDFSPDGLRFIHQELFGDIYDWAGQYRIINIEKRERLLAGRSVWYSNDEDIPHDLQIIFQEMKAVSWTELSHLDVAFQAIHEFDWDACDRETFVNALTHLFPPIWQVHPFREGNTRTIVMLMTFFMEHYGYFMDQELIAASAGYVRDAFVMASIGQYAEYEHLERILEDAICTSPLEYDLPSLSDSPSPLRKKYQKYQKEPYHPEPHYQKDKGDSPHEKA